MVRGIRWRWPRYRGMYLLGWGVIHLMFAITLLTSEATVASAAIHLFLPPPLWALYSLIGGLVAVITAFRMSISTVPAFVLLSTLIFARGVGHVIAAFVFHDWVQIASAVVWFVLVALHLGVARWPNPTGPVRIDSVVLAGALKVALRSALENKLVDMTDVQGALEALEADVDLEMGLDE